MTTGLTLGKFAPLHKGHMAVIERALAENTHVVVLIYDAPETTHIPLPLRAGWINKLYPQVRVISAWDGPTQVGLSPDITRQHDAYLLKTLAGIKIDRFYSSEPYGKHVSLALGAQNIQVDPARSALPISGTLIRQDPYRHRRQLHPIVYADLITRVVFLGAPSTGKTTIARALADKYNTVWMPEYGREYWEANHVNRRLTPQQILEIAQGHIAREDQLTQEANRYLFVDTDATTTQMFGMDYHASVLPEVASLADAAARRYDLAFFCEDDIPYDDTPDRSGAVFRTIFHKQTRADLLCRKIPFITLNGPLEQRIDRVVAILSRFEKYTSLASLL